METIRFTEKKRTSKWPAIFVATFLIIGSSFVAYAIVNEDNPRMLGLAIESKSVETNGLGTVEETDEQKRDKARNINFEIKDISSMDKSSKKLEGNIKLPALYVDGKEIADFNTSIQDEYNTRFTNLKEQMESAESRYSFNVSYTFYDNIVGTRKIVSIVVKQQIIDVDSNKITSERITTYNMDLGSKSLLAQADVLLTILGKDHRDILRNDIKNHIISNNMKKESEYLYSVTGLENFYIQEGILHMVFNPNEIVSDKYGILDIKINN